MPPLPKSEVQTILEYPLDVSQEFTDRSLVDKHYVDSHAGGGGGGGTGFQNRTMQDADYTANTGECIFIDANTFSTNRFIDLSNLTNEGDEIWVINREKTWGLAYSSQNVYGAYGDILNQVYFNTNTYIRMIGGKLRIMIGG